MDEYDAVARRVLNMILELKVQHDQNIKPVNYDKELANYKRAAEQFKKAAHDMSQENQRLQDEIADLEEELRKARAQTNELIIALGTAQEKLTGLGIIRREGERTGYSFVEHMSPESRRVFEQLMRAPGSSKDDR